MAKTKKRRLQFDLSLEEFDRLEKLREDTEATSNVEVFRRAIRLYGWFIEHLKDENKITLTKGDKVTVIGWLV